ncbi:Ldh family oxidoreductase [Enterobacteriaceae bacterium YMB-R22]|uniref:Ldh family oxidoreductase n=1 Tax=Tenebrionicola larvae TaxID=2815733 RepID=UPI002011D7D6|nr:Ldh family oxidoreductase [Tenebrionicola larvae]MBV4412652.1 Ldh family oxidoreductase [Tenebrionicola larvae]
MEQITLTLDAAYDLAFGVLRRNGFSEAHAAAVARNTVNGERDGCASHGLYRIPGCVRTLRAGKVSPDALPTVQDTAPALVKADAAGAFSLLAWEKALPLLAAKTRQCGIAALAINRCVHFSALWADIEPLTEQGLVALACTPSHAWVAPAGGATPLFGTNPLAFGWPRAGKAPFIFDMATSAAARGEIELRRRAGKPVPPGWGLDSEGRETTDPAQILAGAMLPFGGHKGSALAAMVELIAGPLIGDMTSQESLDFDAGAGGLPYGGELIIAMDPRRFLGDDADVHLARGEAMFSAMAAQGARIPGERRHRARARSEAEGVTIPSALYQEMTALG